MCRERPHGRAPADWVRGISEQPVERIERDSETSGRARRVPLYPAMYSDVSEVKSLSNGLGGPMEVNTTPLSWQHICSKFDD